MNKKTLSIFAFSLLLIFLSANFALAQRNLELSYPEIGGETLTTEISLPGFFRYIFNLAIIIGVIIIIGVLIWGGFLYLTSSGKPERYKESKAWLFNGFLGLAFLLGSYLILNTINPQLTILRIKRLPLLRGVVVFDQLATNKLLGQILSSEERQIEISKFLDQGHAKLISSIPDFETEFGQYLLSPYPHFEKFNPASIYILPNQKGETNKDTKIFTFSQKNFRGQKKEYSQAKGECAQKLCQLEKFNSQLPMSLLIKETGYGVYLYGTNPFEEFFTRASISDLRLAKFNFSGKPVNNNLVSLEIRNKREDLKKITDFLVILHEQVNYRGQCRIFFEKRDAKGNFDPAKKAKAETKTTQATSIYEEGEIQVESSAGFDEKNRVFIDNPTAEDFSAEITGIPGPNRLKIKHGIKATDKGVEKGALVRELPLAIQDKDQYGKIGSNLPSSIQVFQLSEKYSGKVKLCSIVEPLPDDNQNCRTYYHPIWIPKYIDQDPPPGPAELNDNLRAVEIDGNFLVVLFEHSPDDPGWPGKCQVFTESNFDLTPEPIGRCVRYDPLAGIIPFWRWKPCSSAFAIYPLKQK